MNHYPSISHNSGGTISLVMKKSTQSGFGATTHTYPSVKLVFSQVKSVVVWCNWSPCSTVQLDNSLSNNHGGLVQTVIYSTLTSIISSFLLWFVLGYLL